MSAEESDDQKPDAPTGMSFVGRYLDPMDRLGELMFGLIMVLTFTLGAGLVVQEGKDSTVRMLLAIVGCNLAWGLIDGGMYLISCLFDRSRKARLLEAVQKAENDEAALAMVAQSLDDRLEPLASVDERNRLYGAILARLRNVDVEPTRVRKEDVYGAIASFVLVFSSTVPAVLPFLVFDNHRVALRVSNGLLLVMLFATGYLWARGTHSNPWVFGMILLLAGLLMVAIAMALGG